MSYDTHGVLWFVGQDAELVVLAHRPDDGIDPRADALHAPGEWDRVLRISPVAAAGIGASLVAHAVELDPDGATTAVVTVLRDTRLLP